MFCQNCGTQLPEGVKFCPECGAPVEIVEPLRNEPIVENIAAEPIQEPVYETPVQQPIVQSNPEAAALSTPILVFGILGLSFACIPYVNFLGIIFSAIAKGKVKQFLGLGGVLSGKAKVGNILATVGLIIGIIFTVIFAIIITVAIFGGILGALGENGYIRGW
ncbi:MAG: zinc ribbon domain-containing protein [Clostridia bacterium]|nr:zinc ribbon domain-containing protein [Clostridia bacterium]